MVQICLTFFQTDKENGSLSSMEMVTEIPNNLVDYDLELDNDMAIVITNTDKEPEEEITPSPEMTMEFDDYVVDYEVELDNSTLTDDEILLPSDFQPPLSEENIDGNL